MSLLLDLLFPRRCFGCGRLGFYLCPRCQQFVKVNSFVPSPSPSGLEGHLALLSYRGAVKKLIIGLKYQFVTDAATEIADLLSRLISANFPTLLHYWQENSYVLVPIPLHPLRRNWRGFNQSEIIVPLLASRLHLSYLPDLLLRPKNTASQVSQSQRHLRHTNISHAFTVSPSYLSRLPSRLILFDDVYTTGATMESAAAAIHQVAPIPIVALTLAG
ncbi:hypothetical protein M1116_01705 [Patescibacteria group bacterium]|nr:hypothetical protein [Patescibacteria group bacterium]